MADYFKATFKIQYIMQLIFLSLKRLNTITNFVIQLKDTSFKSMLNLY